jgi:hypothetical protein
MASFEPRGLGIKKELYSRKSYSGVSVPIGDNFKTGTTKTLARDQPPSQTVTDGLQPHRRGPKIAFPLTPPFSFQDFALFVDLVRTLHLHPHAIELPFLHLPNAVKPSTVQRPSKSFNYLRT